MTICYLANDIGDGAGLLRSLTNNRAGTSAADIPREARVIGGGVCPCHSSERNRHGCRRGRGDKQFLEHVLLLSMTAGPTAHVHRSSRVPRKPHRVVDYWDLEPHKQRHYLEPHKQRLLYLA